MIVFDYSQLEKKIGYNFGQPKLLTQALTHKSASFHHNERLEFLGDAVLSYVIGDILFKRYPKSPEGDLTRARASLVKGSTLTEIAKEFDLGDFVILGQGEKRSGGSKRDSILANCVEAIIGAILLDSSIAECYRCVKEWYIPRINKLEKLISEKDPKTQLQEWLQAKQKSLPIYNIVNIEGEPHQQKFTVQCEIDDIEEAVKGDGRSKRIAEQNAAAKVLDLIKERSRP